MKPKSNPLHRHLGLVIVPFTVASLSLLGSSSAFATSDAWDGSTSTLWSLNTNWATDPLAVPGTGDTATFNNAGNGNTTIDLGGGVTVGSIVFDTSSAAAYTIGSGVVGSQTLTPGTAAGGITLNSTVANNQLVNANLALSVTGAYGITNNSTGGGLTIAGGISASTSGIKALTVAGAGNTEISGVLASGSGTLNLIKSGPGTLTLSNAGTSTIASNLKVSGGLLKITAGTVNVTENSGANTLMNTGGNMEVSGGTLNIAGTGGWFPIGDTSGQTSTLTVSGGAVNITNNFGTEVGRTGGGVLTVSSGSFKNADTGNIGLILGDSGTGVGTVNLDGGSLLLNKISSNTANANKFYFNGGTLKPTATNATWYANSTNVSSEVRNGGAFIDTAGFNATIGEALVHSTFAGTNATDGGLTKNGAGILTLSGVNTYTGGTTVNAGTLAVGNGSALGAGGVILAGGILSNSSNQTITNAISVTAASSITALTGTNFTVNSSITGSGSLGVSGILNAAGLLLGGNNSGFTGTATVTGANTRLTSANAGSSSAAWVVDGNLQLEVAGTNTFNLGALSSTVSTGGISGHATNASAATSTLSVGALNTNTVFGGTIANMPNNTAALGNLDGATNNILALTKVGSGSLALSGTSTYTGATTINAGKLVVNGNISTSVLTTVNSTGTLGGSGTVGALTVASGGTVAPGNSPGILSAGNTSLQSGSTLGIELNGTGVGTDYDQLNVTGTVSLAGALAVTMGYSPVVNGTLFFILANDSNDAITGTFSNAPTDGATYTFGGQDFQISYFGNYVSPGVGTFTGGNDVVLVAVPEPGAALLGGLGMLALLRRRRA